MTHLDTDVLAEFRAGLITGRRGAKITAHLAGCDHCTALDDQLARVSALLASVPAPAMPDSVAQRLDAALAAEVAAETARKNDPERARRELSPEPAASPRRPGHRGFRLMSLRVLAPVAAAVVVLAAGGYGLSLLTSRGSQTVASSTESSAASAASRANQAIGAAPEPTASAQGPTQVKGPARSLHPANFPFVTSGKNFSSVPATLRQQVEAALRAAPAAGSGQAAPAQVRACVQRLAGGDTVLLAENARFEGQPATLVVARAGQAKKVWVAGPGCARVLATTSLLPGISGP
jgi:hypothetical protein